jgi:hypothetical protein
MITYMNGQIISINSFEELLVKLQEIFETVEPGDLKDLLFFLQDFKVEHPQVEECTISIEELPLEGMEVNENKISTVLVEGITKYTELHYQKNNLPPVVVLKGNIRELILHGEMNAVEGYVRKMPVKSIILDIGDQDIFEKFKIDPTRVVFLIPAIQRNLIKST